MSKKDPLIEAVTPITNWFVVLRPFGGDNGEFVRGQVVDTSEWRHTGALASRRYIAPLPYGAKVPNEVVGDDGVKRRILAEESAPVEEPVAEVVETAPTTVAKKSKPRKKA